MEKSFRSTFHQTVASFVATLGVLGLGTVLGWSSPSLPDMIQEPHGHFVNITLEQQSWIGASATLGAFASGPVAGLSIEKLGRKRTMVFYSIPFTLGWILIGFSYDVIFMCLGRFITGFCGGIFSLSAPVYIGEVSNSKIRGMLLNIFQLMLVSGILIIYVMGVHISWKALALLSSVIPLAFLCFSLLMPESPRYLIASGKPFEAQKALCWLRGTHNTDKVSEEFSMMQSSVQDGSAQSTTFCDLLKPNILKPLLITLLLMVLEQMSAFNVIIFYCVDIFKATGSTLDANWASIIVAGVQVLATIVATFLVDNAGRRILLLFSEAVMGLSFLGLGAFFYVMETNQEVATTLAWLPLVSVLLFIIAFSVGIGPLSWTIMGEMLHPNVKGLCSSIAVALVWLSASFVTKIYQTLVQAVGLHWAFWIFSSVSIIGTFLVYFFVPETKGKTLDEIQALFQTKRKESLKS